MSAAPWFSVRAAFITVLTVFAWLFLQLIYGYWWQQRTMDVTVVEGAVGLWGLEVLIALPDLVYFLVVGGVLYYVSGPNRTVVWPVLSALTAMVIKALWTQYTFLEPSFVDAGILLVSYGFPVLCAIAGAFAAKTVLARMPDGRAET